MSEKRDDDVFTTNQEGKLFVRVDRCGIAPMVILIDGVPLVRFGDKGPYYISADAVVEWFESEHPQGIPAECTEHVLVLRKQQERAALLAGGDR